MRHDWIFDVLADLRVYAMQHGLMALAAKTEEVQRVARAEVAAARWPPPVEAEAQPCRDSG
ncbi:MAG: hypothetical protein KGH84_16250 [Paracoccaceae bacterium]|nr:hypothetical protein [Paracoccaceae bacterium]